MKMQNLLQQLLPSIEILGSAPTSGQRAVFFAKFDDSKIPSDIRADSEFLHGWESWGKVAVKICTGISASDISRLQFEAEILEQCGGRFPKQYYADLITENPVTEEALKPKIFLTIEEFIPSVPLSERIANFTTEQEVIPLLLQICECLRPLWEHPRKLVHRDLKPANILVREDGGIVVIDLGIARETGVSGLTMTASAHGPMTPRYAAPEQLTNDKHAICYKTDFFSLGVLAYELLSGHHPFLSEEDVEFEDYIVMVSNTLQKPLASLPLGISTGLSDIVNRMLEKAPYRRPRTPELLVNQLQGAAKNVY